MEGYTVVSLEQLILRVKRGDSAPFAAAKWLYKAVLTFSLPSPRFLRPVGNGLYHGHFLIRLAFWRLGTVFYREPLFRYRCESVGKRLSLFCLPEATAHTRIYVGDDVTFHGKVGVYSGRVFDAPVLRIGSRVSIGHMVTFSCNKEIIIEDDVLIAGFCAFYDNDGHPIDPELRKAGYAPPRERTKPLRICQNAWVGAGCHILKGVTIGEGSIVGSGSVVTEDVPPYSIVAGNPAKLVRTIPNQRVHA